MTQGRAQHNVVTIGGRKDGTVLAYRLDVLQDTGAYPRFGGVLPSLTLLMAPAVYDFPKLEVRARCVVTNTTSLGAYRGAGRPEATHAVERAMDLFAAETGVDPAEVRRRVLVPKFDRAAHHADRRGLRHRRLPGGAAQGARGRRLRRAARRAAGPPPARRRQAARHRPLGLRRDHRRPGRRGRAVARSPTSRCTPTARRRSSPAPRRTGRATPPPGRCSPARRPASRSTRSPSSTATPTWCPDGTGTFGSRSLQQGGAAVRQATIELVGEARKRVAELLEANPDDLVVDKDRAAMHVAGSPDTAVTFASLAETEPLKVRTVFSAPGPTFPFGAHLAVVEVDTRTGKSRLQRLIAVDDAGTILNPLLAEGQRHGGYAQGAAQALHGGGPLRRGRQPRDLDPGDYPFLSITEVPSFEAVPMATADAVQPARRQGRRRGRHHRRHPGRAQRGHRRRVPPRRPPHRHAHHPAAGLAGHLSATATEAAS